MKCFLIVLVLVALGGVDCAGRRRRFAFGPPKAVAAPPAVAAAVPSPLAAKSSGMDAAIAPMDAELEKEEALGGPVNTAGLTKAASLAKEIQGMGEEEVDPAKKDELELLTADFVAESVDFSDFLKSADKPEDTSVNMPPGAPSAAAERR